MRDDKKEMPINWAVDQEALGRINSVFGFRLFMHLWKTTDPQYLITKVELPEEMTKGVSRQTIWRAFSGLEAAGLLRRNKSWSTIFLNPSVVHPYWMKGHGLAEKIACFKEEASVRFVIKGEPKVEE